ncbi:MAG: hypothetical protein L0Z50_23710 [Verrucomicrobiales bacterium]|nr:hypothetical protein [Verrucomicrobiales bacterium]
MKKQILRLAALGAVAMGLLATDQGQANFSGTTWGWPNPESSGYLGQGSVWNGSAPNYANGWSLARWIGSAPEPNLSWCGFESLNSSSDITTTGCGAAQSHGGYRLVEFYWDGSTHDYGQSKIWGAELQMVGAIKAAPTQSCPHMSSFDLG